MKPRVLADECIRCVKVSVNNSRVDGMYGRTVKFYLRLRNCDAKDLGVLAFAVEAHAVILCVVVRAGCCIGFTLGKAE
jgi:hypothetical protein